jgi:hypothetical protein
MGKLLEISKVELEMLEAWAKHGTLKDAAEALSIPLSTLSNRKSRVRWRYRQARDFVREVERWQAKLPGALE